MSNVSAEVLSNGEIAGQKIGEKSETFLARRRASCRHSVNTLLLLVPGMGYILGFAVLLFAIMAAQSFGALNPIGESVFTLSHWQNVFGRQFFDSLFYSLRTGLISSLLTLCVCYPLAMLISGSKLQKTLLALLKIPMFIPALVASFLMLNLVDYNGFVNTLLLALGVVKEPLRMRNDPYSIGVIFIQIWKNIPTQLIIMYSAILSVRKDVRDAAKNLGCRGLRLFWEITLPLTVSSALIAVLLVFIGVFGDFVVSKTAGPVYPNSLSLLLQAKASLFQDWGGAACIGVVMVFTAMLVVILYTYLVKLLARIGC